MRLFFTGIAVFVLGAISFSQGKNTTIQLLENRVSHNPDSVKNVLLSKLNLVNDPRKRIPIHHLLGVAYNNVQNYDSAVYHLQLEDSLLQDYTPSIEVMVENQTALADIYYTNGNLVSAEKYYQNALLLSRKSTDYKLKCQALLACGWIAREQGRHAEALDYYFEAISLTELNKDELLLANCYAKIGIVYNVKGDLEKARNYYFLALDIQLKHNNISAVGGLYNNIGLMHEYAQNYDSAIFFFEKAYHIADSLNDERSIAIANENIGLMHYQKREDLDVGLDRLKVSLDIWRSKNDIFGQCQTLVYMVFIYNYQKRYATALDSSFRSLNMAKEAGANDVQQQILEQIYLAYQGLGKHDKALEYYQKFDALRDSLSSLNTTAEIDKLALSHEFESRQLQDSLALAMKHEKEQSEIMVRVESGKFWNKLLLFGLLALIAIVVLAIIMGRQQKRNSKLVAKANLLLQAKNKEIIDSITYAKRIQNAILPTTSLIRSVFKNSFVFYAPKDIVAGDFYWLSEVNLSNNKLIYFAVADCTGHGVPGAMVSVICSSALNKAINEMHIQDPGAILNKVTDLVIETFEKSDNELKDGMDIALCCFNFESGELLYSGANNALWIVSDRPTLAENSRVLSDGMSAYHLHEIKATKQPVGKYTKRMKFDTHSIQLKTNDLVYLFTDGFADQFGGLKNKKYKYSSLKKLLLSVAGRSVEDQRVALKNSFEAWKGAMEQVDDVCIVGIRV